MTTVNRAAGVQQGPAATKGHTEAQQLRDAAYAARLEELKKSSTKSEYEPDVANWSFKSQKAALKELDEWGHEEASGMAVIPEQGMPTLRVVQYDYHSNKPMEAWLDSLPADGKLKFRVIACVSGHDNLPHEQFAKSNIYDGAIMTPNGRVKFPQFGPGVSKKTEHASLSPVLEIDVSKPGDYSIECYPLGSALTGGYVELRKLVLHVLPKQS